MTFRMSALGIAPRITALVLAATLVMAATTSARAADTAAASQRAEELYLEGKKLAAAGAHAEACPKFEESQKLEPAIGTQFNLADCYEALGKRASALALFREVMRAAQLTGKQERLRAAEQRANGLEQGVPRIVVDAKKQRGDVRVRIDDIEVSVADATRGIPADPGTHDVRVEAVGFRPWQSTVVVEAKEGFRVTAEAPPLAPLEREVVRPVEVSVSSPPLRPLGIALLGAGGAGLVVGGIFGIVTINQKDAAGCDGIDCRKAPVGSADKLAEAQTSGTISTIGFVAGGVLAAAGLGVLVLGPSGARSSASTAATLSLSVTPSGAGLRGAF